MMELLIQLEYKREEFRAKLLNKFAHGGHSLFALAGVVLLLSFSSAICPPAALLVAPSSLLTAAELGFMGIILLISIVAAPISLLLF